MARAPIGKNSVVERIVAQADIVDVAQRLGLQLDKRATKPRLALCPFHSDHSPSLRLYHGGADRDHFHCFACGAHGDTVSLVQRQRKLEFWDAIKLLGNFTGVELPERGRAPVDRRSGAMFLSEELRKAQKDPALTEFAARREFTPALLREAGASVYDLRRLITEAIRDRVIQEKLVQAGILRLTDDVGGPSLFVNGLRGFFFDRRLVIPMSDIAGVPVGFAARALTDTQPRYLYSYEFPKRDTLYGADRVSRALRVSKTRGNPSCIHLVEGIFDQLRFESLGMQAVAILGARISSGQVELLKQLVRLAEEANRELTIRIFLDPDDAGRRGAFDAVLSVMRLLDQTATFRLEVIVPPQENRKLDPDEFLKGHSPERAEQLLQAASVKPLKFLLSVVAGCTPWALNLSEIGSLQLAAAARRIAGALPNVSWTRVLAPLDDDTGLLDFEKLVRSYGEKTSSSGRSLPRTRQEGSDDRAALITALTMGRSSTARREYPLDDDAWERLAVAASPFFHIHSYRLRIGDGPSAPLLARHVPKGNGHFRLKSGPVAHDALLQQYALVELLRDRPEAPDFASLIPAVRFSQDQQADAKIYTTGLGGAREGALSFAYQVDMAIVNGVIPPRREGIFRPYFECWRSFIDFLEGRVRRYRHEELQVLRLDVTGFYEHVMRGVVGDALQQPLERAITLLGQSDGGPKAFARMLQPDRSADTSERAHLFTEFLLKNSFGLNHLDPETGEARQVKGLPQGPDLSAYLANISLFSLDERMAAEIERLNTALADDETNQCSAAYARYVDDIIIICPNVEIAAQLRRIVEAHLQTKGLSLNRKHSMPPPMTRAEARGWLTDNRVGFGFSGPLAEMPVTESMDPLADAGDIDRRTALGLLFDPELDDPRKDDLIVGRIGLALQATEVRFGDRANAYRRFWQIASIKADEGDADGVANVFASLVFNSEPASGLIGEGAIEIALACFEALDRALRSRVPEGIGEEINEVIGRARKRLACAALGDVFSLLAKKIFSSDQDRAFLRRYDVRCQVAIIAALAVDVLGSDEVASDAFGRLKAILQPMDGERVRELPKGLRLSLYLHDASFDDVASPPTVPGSQQVQNVFHRLETALVQLQRFGSSGDDLPPASPLLDQVEGLDRLAFLILRVWSPGDEPYETEPFDPVELDAASTLVNVTYQNFVKVAERRPRLLRLIVGETSVQALPSPPGLATSGLLLWCEDGRLLLASAGEVEFKPQGADWRPLDNTGGPFHLMQATLDPGTRPLFSNTARWTPARIAATYRAGFAAFSRQIDAAANQIPVPTVFSFFGLERDGVPDPSSTKLVCWSAPRLSVDAHAFVRCGTALEARSVHAEGADYWRFGWAVRDLSGRADGPLDGDASLDEHCDAKLDRESFRLDAILARVLPRISGADRWGPGAVPSGSVLPTRIERALGLLEAFDRSQAASDQATYLIAATAEGLFMNERLNVIGDPGVAGRPAAIAQRAARRVSRALPSAAAYWPLQDIAITPYRRTSAAWFETADRLTARIGSIENDAVQPLRILSLGVRLLGTVSDLRSLAFEISGALGEDNIRRLRSRSIDLNWISELIGYEVAFLDLGTALDDSSLETQTGRLLETFENILIGRRNSAPAARDAITPLGWVVLVSILLHVSRPKLDVSELRVGLSPALWPMAPVELCKASESLGKLISFLGANARGDTDSSAWPWDVFQPLAAVPIEYLSETLRNLTDATRVVVSTVESWSNPRTSENEDGRLVMRMPDGSSHRLAEWQVEVAYINGERGTSTESYEDGYRNRYRYSVTRIGDRVLGMHLVSRGLAKIAFGRRVPEPTSVIDYIEAENLESKMQKSNGDGLADVNLNDENIIVGIDAPASTVATKNITMPHDPNSDYIERAHGLDILETVGEELHGELDGVSAGVPKDLQSHQPLSLDDVIARIRVIQEESWQKRPNKSQGVQRIAIVQWDVVDTYYAPGHLNGMHEGLRHLDGTVVKSSDNEIVIQGGPFLSEVEGRRRAILLQVLRVCARFKVDGLVLPEYSVRPETVNWILRRLVEFKLELTVWCGTFRVPDGGMISSPIPPRSGVGPYFPSPAPSATGFVPSDFHAALLTCLDAGKTDKGFAVHSHVRRKRYPSAAAGEIIRPPVNEQWRPLLSDEVNAFKLGSFTIELICSEMFPHASSANYIGVLDENRRLALRYFPGWSDNDAIKSLNDDIHVFAKWTAYRHSTIPELSRGKRLQRTVIILPAMTSRSADYHIFGQNQYLAAGLVTAFCNAVEPQAGCGGSAFIGLDGWKATIPVATPYGSIAPGIFQLSDKHSGPLGAKEAAIVIADLDPMRTADQRPRPHYQARSLELVAHLPLIFATETQVGERKRKLRLRADKGSNRSFREAAREVLDVLEELQKSPLRWYEARSFEHPDREVRAGHEAFLSAITQALVILEEFADDPVWLRKRRKAFLTERWTYPPPTALPALIDWLYVDDEWKNFKIDSIEEHSLDVDIPVLDVPRSSGAPPKKEREE